MTIEALLDAKLIKEHSRKRGYFFTNPDMQDVVAEFMAPGPVPTFLVPTPQSTPTVASPSGLVCSSLDKQVLRAIKSAPHAVDHQEIVRLVNDNPLCVGTSIGFLAGLGLIRMHRSKPNHYFTNSDKAGEINTLLATVATTTPQGEPVPTDAVLAMLRLSEHGISMNGVWKAFEKLVAEGLVRADKRDVDAKSKDVRYFVRKGKRREGDLRAKADKRIAKLIAGNDDLVDYVNEAADSIG
jgi:DNA-binding transcriptional regulator YhcF (GntR family)